MKYLLILLIFISCHKDELRPVKIPVAIYGNYQADITSNTGHWEQALQVINKNSTEVYFIFSGNMFGDTLTAQVALEITIPSQQFTSTLQYPYSISGIGQYSTPQITLTIAKSIQSDVISYQVTAIHN